MEEKTQSFQKPDINRVISPKIFSSFDDVHLNAGDMFFSPGHALHIYALGLMKDSNVLDMDGARHGIVNADDLLHNRRFLGDPDLQEEFFNWLGQELGQGHLQFSLRNLQDESKSNGSEEYITDLKKLVIRLYRRSVSLATGADRILTSLPTRESSRYTGRIKRIIDATLGPVVDGKRQTPTVGELIHRATKK